MPATASAPRASELVFSRVFEAPRELLFELWTDPQHIGHWWGPEGFTTTTNAMDAEVGGVWDYVMHGPDGTDYPGRSVYTGVEKPKRLIFDHVGGRADDPHLTCRMTVTFEETDGKTELKLRMLFPSADAAERAVESGAAQGGHETLARLGDSVADAVRGRHERTVRGPA